MSETATEQPTIALHWLMVGYISDKAREWITECGGQVKQVNDSPILYAVGIAYNPDGTWVWSKGKRQFRQGVEFWSMGEIQEASTGITLLYKSWADGIRAESDDTRYLLCPDEEFDVETKQAKPVEYVMASSTTSVTWTEDDHPF